MWGKLSTRFTLETKFVQAEDAKFQDLMTKASYCKANQNTPTVKLCSKSELFEGSHYLPPLLKNVNLNNNEHHVVKTSGLTSRLLLLWSLNVSP